MPLEQALGQQRMAERAAGADRSGDQRSFRDLLARRTGFRRLCRMHVEAIGALRGERARLNLRDAQSSCLVQEDDSDQARHVIMPLRL